MYKRAWAFAALGILTLTGADGCPWSSTEVSPPPVVPPVNTGGGGGVSEIPTGGTAATQPTGVGRLERQTPVIEWGTPGNVPLYGWTVDALAGTASFHVDRDGHKYKMEYRWTVPDTTFPQFTGMTIKYGGEITETKIGRLYIPINAVVEGFTVAPNPPVWAEATSEAVDQLVQTPERSIEVTPIAGTTSGTMARISIGFPFIGPTVTYPYRY